MADIFLDFDKKCPNIKKKESKSLIKREVGREKLLEVNLKNFGPEIFDKVVVIIKKPPWSQA